jgi:hypothetical protein
MQIHFLETINPTRSLIEGVKGKREEKAGGSILRSTKETFLPGIFLID